MTEYNHLTDPLRNKRITASMVDIDRELIWQAKGMERGA